MNYLRLFRQATIPKNFRVWDFKHRRWFQGNPDDESRKLGVDSIHYFGEVLSILGTSVDQNNDDVWKFDDEIHSSLEIPNWLVVVQDTGFRDVEGRHIFEGDIVKIKNRFDLFVVAYYNGQYLCITKDVKEDIKSFSLDGNFEIRGTIFDKKFSGFCDILSEFLEIKSGGKRCL